MKKIIVLTAVTSFAVGAAVALVAERVAKKVIDIAHEKRVFDLDFDDLCDCPLMCAGESVENLDDEDVDDDDEAF